MNHSNCSTCDHKLQPNGGWCYMFKREPKETCKQHTGNFQRISKAVTEGDMKIKTIADQLGNDFSAVMECEHCGHEQKITTGYDDAYYHRHVIPAMTCHACGKNRTGDIPAQRNDYGTASV